MLKKTFVMSILASFAFCVNVQKLKRVLKFSANSVLAPVCFLCMSLCSPFTASALVKGDVSVGDFWFWLGTISNPYAQVSDLNSNASGHYMIPESINVNGAVFTVNKVHSLAFLSNIDMIKSMTIPQTIKEIGDAAFYSSKKGGVDTLIIKDSPDALNCTAMTCVNNEYLGQFARTSIKYLYLGRDLEFIPYSLHYRNYTPFNSVNTFEHIEIGEYVTSFEPFYDLSYCDNLKKISLHTVTPPSCSESMFSKLQYLNIEIEVPEGSMDSYKSTLPWSNFLNLKEYRINSFMIKGAYDQMKGSVFANRQSLEKELSFNKGTDVELLILPKKNYELESVLVNGEEMISKLENNIIELSAIKCDISVEVVFSLPKHKVRLATNGGGYYELAVSHGNPATIGFVAEDNWELHKVYVNNVDYSNSIANDKLKLDNIEEDYLISAVFVNTTNIQRVENKCANVRISGNTIIVEKITDLSKIEFFDINGRLLKKGSDRLKVDKGSYIVRCGKISFKVMI